ncbi:hypothetical protein F5X96DRAFT_693527 [Biscogniauxia mediterranea]|nr:hypothetical protein F5X96DRAFT_693527 [Biscogniauxia mediterranea]
MSDGESDDGKRTSKKRKASRACDRCNSQHQPCDNAVPKCSVCVRAGTECTYNRPVRKRGPRSGYTGQNGERLWAIVLQAKPELEDVVLQILRRGTYASTGISNMDYYRNNDNQAELVSRFNESRLGRFLQNGETPDLNLPPLDQELPAITSHWHGRSESSFRQQTDSPRLENSNRVESVRQNRSVSTSSAAHSGIVNPHGAPQNPGDIYEQSEDIRKRAFNPAPNQIHGYDGRPSQGPSLDLAFHHHSPSALTGPQSTQYESNGSIDEYGDQGTQITNHGIIQHRNSISRSTSALQQSHQPGLLNSAPLGQDALDFSLAGTSQWLDSIPTDTLVNLGFVPGERMTADFLELCENPDPIESTSSVSADQNEDEEAIWRRLVMRGRFI